MNKVLLGFLLFAFSSSAFGQQSALKDYNIGFLLSGYFFAGSKIEDKQAFGGFSSSNNFPKPVGTDETFPPSKISLIAFPDNETIFEKYFKGIKVVLTNTTRFAAAFDASDSRLYIVQEAIDTDGKWKPVEYLPSSWCGNSYHRVFLGPNEYWEFSAAKFNGSYKTRLRFRLHRANRKDTRPIYSNEFDGSVNPSQFTVQPPRTSDNIVPYTFDQKKEV